jgi:hypothetical protein
MPLTAIDVKNAKPRAKRYRLADGHGLYLEVMPTGARYWRMKYRSGGKEKRLALGVFPEVSLVDARDGVDQARALLKKGIDPTAQRKTEKLVRATSSERTFEILAREWLSKQTHMAETTFSCSFRSDGTEPMRRDDYLVCERRASIRASSHRDARSNPRATLLESRMSPG